MNTEITEQCKEWVFYDADCAICRGFVERWQARLNAKGVGMTPLQGERAKRCLGLAPGAPLDEMKLLTAHGEVLGGADAIIYLARYFWWGWGLRLMAQVPGARPLLRRAYTWFAARRHCWKGGCKI